MKEIVEAHGGKKVYVYCWDKVREPKAMVQIFHGMGEHAGRCKEFAEYLNKHGYLVYASDHRGHGKTAGSVENLAYIGEDGFNAIIEDKHLIFQQMRKEHPELPMILIGHSFGSFLSQEYITKYANELKGVALLGSAAQKGLKIHAGYMIAAIGRSIFGEKRQSSFMDFLSFRNFNNRFKSDKSKHAWICSDMDVVKKYEEDPFCGGVSRIGFYYYFLKALKNLYKQERLDKIPKGLPIYIAAGEEDPVGEYSKSVYNLFKIYKEFGINDVKLKLYSKMRHEILNEVNKKQVFKDLLDWLNTYTK